MTAIGIGGIIRDKAPDQLEAAGYLCRVRETSGRELNGLLRSAVQNSLREYMAQPGIHNLADLLDLVYQLGEKAGISPQDLEKARESMLKEQGGFERGLVLEALGPKPQAEQG